MIVIPMLGKSTRFFNAGYTLPKYQLPLGRKETVFFHVLKSFQKYFHSEPFVFLTRKDYGASSFVAQEIDKLGISDFRVIEFAKETRGQAESVELGLRDYCESNSVLIFNIDTIRKNFKYPINYQKCDGFLEVFYGQGNNWSFVKAGKNNRVNKTTEKVKISDLCSNGLYYFSRIELFRKAYKVSAETYKSEFYIAPLYNYLIKNNYYIKYVIVDSSQISHCGVPADYELLNARMLAQ